MSSFLDLADAGNDTDTVAPPKKSFLDLAGAPPKATKAAKAPTGLAPGGIFADLPQSMRDGVIRDVQAGGDGSGRAPTYNGAALDAQWAAAPASGAGRGSVNPPLASQPQPTRGGFVPGTFDNTPHVPSDHGAYVPPDPSESWWDKARGGLEATAGTVLSVPAGVIGMLSHPGDSKAAGEVTGGVVNGAMKYLGMPPMSPTGQRYMGNVGDTIAPVADSLTGIAPLSEFAHGLGAVGDVAAGAKANVMGRGAAPAAARVEPTLSGAAPAVAGGDPALLKPRYQMVNGQPTLVGSTPAAAFTPPTVADASPAMQKAVAEAKATGAVNPQALAAHVEADTLRVPGRLTQGQATGDPTLISKENNTRGGAQPAVSPDFYKEQGQTVAANLEANRAAAAPDIPLNADMADHGQMLIDAYKQKDAAAQKVIAENYRALADAKPGNAFLQGADVKSAVASALDTAEAHRSPFLPSAIQSAVSSLPDDMSLARFENLRTQLATAARSTAAQQDGNVMGAINAARSAVESLPMSEAAGPIKALADKARASARAQFQAVDADPAYSAAVNDSVKAGAPSPLADRFVNNYALRSAAARADVATMAQNLSDNPQATQALRAAAVDHLNAQMKADGAGNFNQAAYNKALEALGGKVSMLVDPETAYYLKATGNYAKNAQVQPRGSYVNNSNTLVGYLANKAGSLGATTIEKVGNVIVPGAGLGTDLRTAVGGAMDRRAAAKASSDALKPGAGITARLSDLAK